MLFLSLLVYLVSSSACWAAAARQKRAWIIDSYEMEEGHPGPFPYELGEIKLNRSYMIKFDLRGQGVDEEPLEVFSIDEKTGKISVLKPVDYEMFHELKLSFEAKKADYTIDTRLGIEIVIKDINDNPPRFEQDLYEFTVNEDETQGKTIAKVEAYDMDKIGTENATFSYRIKSVAPVTPNLDFFVTKNGMVSFKGCFDHEVSDKYTVLVEAVDNGEVVRLSSSTSVVISVEDDNNHLPVFSGQTGTGEVKENEVGTSPLRLHVTDKDTFKSKAWKAKYSIQNNEGDHFKIETDPDTNDGILTVVRALDFEKGVTRELLVSVENEIPYFICKVKERTKQGLWKVDFSKDLPPESSVKSTTVTIKVVDVNDPPEFMVSVKEATLEENAPIGTWVEKVTAVDRDTTASRDFIYKVGEDPAGWMTVDSRTGDITTVKMPDRESSHVIKGTYTLILHAVDQGKPAMTGTATLLIHLIDVNDNKPKLASTFVYLCMSDGPSSANVSATDPDGQPYGGPFNFELLGNVQEKWRFDPQNGFWTDLVRDPSVHPGLYTLDMKISDLQGVFSVQTLNVTVCSCTAGRNCRSRGHGANNASGAIGIILASLLFFFLILLLVIRFECKEEKEPIEIDAPPVRQTLLDSHTETPGTDCKVPEYKPIIDHQEPDVRDHWWRGGWQTYEEYYVEEIRKHLFSSIQLKHSSLQNTEKDIVADCEPHVWAEEGGPHMISDLESIIEPYEENLQDLLEDLAPSFYELALVCNSQVQSTQLVYTQHTVY